MNHHHWGRRDDAGRWIGSLPTYTMGAVVVAGLTVCLAATYRYHRVWTQPQRAYLVTYLSSAAASAFALPPKRYELPSGAGTYDNREVMTFLRAGVYGGDTLPQLARAPLMAGGVVLLIGLVISVPRDVARRWERRHGKRLKGPQMVDAATFNAALAADGIGIVQEQWPTVRIPRAKEASHVLILGDTGSGKSALIRQFLCQIRDRGDERVVVYDPACEYVPQFYDHARGDQVLNPLDARCPCWSPADEVIRDAEALTLAVSLFPEQPHENPFFTQASRRIFAYLLTQRPHDAAELARWLSNGAELDRLLHGTSYAHMINADAPAQRSGVLSSLNMQADTLAMLAPIHAGDVRWSAAEWAANGRGWLFVTSGPETQERQIPLMTLWLDLLMLRLMPKREAAKTWMVIDELASLRKLPQLATAMTQSRKANTALVLGFQAKSQLEAIYGHAAEAMLSQPSTKIVLATSEANSAKWLSDTIGQVEIERMRQSRSAGLRGATTFALERHVEPLVLPSEVEILPDRSGYLKYRHLVTPIRFPYLQLPNLVPGFVERPPARPVVSPRPAGPPTVRVSHAGQTQLID